MKKKIFMGLFVLTAVIGMGFAASYYACGHVKNRNGNKNDNVYYKCKECTEQDANYADRFKKKQDEICTQPDDKLTVKDYNDYDCKTYRENNNNSNNNNSN